MTRRNDRNAFTLIELLTVMAIITLLIGILTPALGAARDRARATAVRAQLAAMEVGLESFHFDEGKYPASNLNFFANDPSAPAAGELDTQWEVSGTNPLQGAHLLVDALVGRDFLGYDFKPGTVAGVDPNSRWDSRRDRRKPYIPVDGVDVTSLDKPPEDGRGKIPGMTAGIGAPQPSIDGLLCRVFRDKFGWPILYYRASLTADPTTPIIQTAVGLPVGDGVYDGQDNEVFTSYTSSPHKISDASNLGGGSGFLVGPPPLDYTTILTNKFAEFIRSIRATGYDTQAPPRINYPRPVKADSFILLSAGKDGIYGNVDDVANYQVLSTER